MKTQEKEILFVFRHLLKMLNVPVTYQDLNEYWQAHPDYLSMVFFADACKKYKIKHAALELSPSEFGKNGFPFIAHLVDKGGHFVVVENINDQTKEITYYHPSEGEITTSLKDFSGRVSGSVFYALPDDRSGETDYFSNRVKEFISRMCRPLFWVILFILLAGPLFLIHPVLTQMFILFLGIKIAGLFICIHLLYHELAGENRVSQAVCHRSKYTGCDEVLQSPASRIWGIHMSDLGFVYFGGGIMAMLFSLFFNIQPVTLSVLFVLTCCSIPYVLFSVYYQLFKVRKICPFCMSVLFVLMMEWILAFTHPDVLNTENLFGWQIVFPVGCLLLALCGWIITKPVIQKAIDGSVYKYKYLRLKKNPHIFNASLEKAPAVDMEIMANELILGNPDATVTVTSVINTHCAPCARMHRRVHSILEEYGKDIRVVIRFMLAGNNQKETFFFVRLYCSEGASAFSEALHDWFENKNYTRLVQKYAERKMCALENEMIRHWTKWYEKEKISSTPTLFLNDKKIDQEYDIDDIRWLVQNSLYDEFR